MTLLGQGRGDDALEDAMRESDEVFRLWALAIVHHVLGHGSESNAALQGLIEKHAEDSAYQIAEAYAARGDVKRAFEWLDRAYAQGDIGLASMMANPGLRSIHGDPRWGAFLKKMGLPD